MVQPSTREADVIVVGAGLSGMIAARKLLEAGLTPLVLEADERVGGRILTEEVVPGIPVELGAQWIGDTHERMFRLAAELGVETYPQYDEGETSYELADSGVLRENEFHARFESELKELELVLRRLDVLAEEVPVEAPWSAPRALEWDAITAGAWYDAQGLSPVARTLLEICTVGILAVPTAEVSFLHLLFTINTCGVTSELFAESEGGAQTTRFVGGTSEIPKRLAALISDRIVLNVPVQLIEHSADSVTVHCRGGLVARGRRVIVAISPTLAGRIMYDPPLPGIRDQLTQRLPNGSAMKAFFIYDEPFWRNDGFNGQLISDVGPARMSNDTCIPGDDRGVILLFLEGDQARTYGRLPESERREALTAELVRHYGSAAAKPQFYIDGEWSERQWTRGCYNANHGPHVWTTYGSALSTPIGAIHWASTDTATYWSAYMEGAVDAGERAAEAVIAELGRAEHRL
ncbi:monoamine oxidase [Mycolicibacterium moriokaense]|uniref:Monoamine oxidase n=1 Tax=Mycolicibacterium moriokaense TaxID=39691 RepID=A0AAD1M535_9MYCO|nr:FAD-dependent oxidoreductase [Mycolicibacterium moriokaense]MCV7039013.1 FAD-dependent oxidoreductase [Mycolicibacterium moriokaense]ORB20393.1 monoamine oxidase [Mycolicibacterium moriokaense]BBW99913.1 monoamine oxidase [Mycolicibacterium moriokaense]